MQEMYKPEPRKYERKVNYFLLIDFIIIIAVNCALVQQRLYSEETGGMSHGH